MKGFNVHMSRKARQCVTFSNRQIGRTMRQKQEPIFGAKNAENIKCLPTIEIFKHNLENLLNVLYLANYF